MPWPPRFAFDQQTSFLGLYFATVATLAPVGEASGGQYRRMRRKDCGGDVVMNNAATTTLSERRRRCEIYDDG